MSEGGKVWELIQARLDEQDKEKQVGNDLLDRVGAIRSVTNAAIKAWQDGEYAKGHKLLDELLRGSNNE